MRLKFEYITILPENKSIPRLIEFEGYEKEWHNLCKQSFIFGQSQKT
jgi:hypothetical protein